MPALEEAPPFVPNLNERNPWREHNDPSESDLSNLQWRQVGPGRFAVTGTMYRTMSPDEFARGGGAAAIHGPGAMGGFAALLNNIVGGAFGGAGTPHPPPGAQNAQTTVGQDMPRSGSGTTPEGHRFTYTAGARLHPRDEFNQGPRIEPVGDLSKYFLSIFWLGRCTNITTVFWLESWLHLASVRAHIVVLIIHSTACRRPIRCRTTV